LSFAACHIDPMSDDKKPAAEKAPPASQSDKKTAEAPKRPKEIGGPSGPEPTRYGDWERNGRCSDF